MCLEKEGAQIRLHAQLTGLVAGGAARQTFGGQLQSGSQVPHLDRSVWVARQNKAPRSWTHPRGALALVDAKRGYCCAVDGTDYAHSVAVGGKAYVELINVGNHLLHENLLIVLLTKRTEIVAGRVAETGVRRIECNYLQRTNNIN